MRGIVSVENHTLDDIRQHAWVGFQKLGVPKSRRSALVEQVIEDGTLLLGWQKSLDTEMANLGVGRLSQFKPRRVLMWSHYAKEHKGVCFQFDTAGSPSVFAHARSVQYDDHVRRVDWLDSEKRGGGLLDVLFRKHTDWAYEQESRIVFPACASRPLKFNARALTAAILGCNSEEALAESVVELYKLRKAAGHPAVKIFKAGKAFDRYTVVMRRLRELEDHV